MLADIQSGHITGLIFSKLARLARNTKELLDFAELSRESDDGDFTRSVFSARSGLRFQRESAILDMHDPVG